jgi:cell division protein ZapA
MATAISPPPKTAPLAKAAPKAALGAAPAVKSGTAMRSLDIKILDRDYKVACKEDEKDSLLVAVAFLDSKMREIREAAKIAGTDRIAVMAALNIAHELLTAKSPSGFDIGEYKRTISSMHSVIDEAIESQEKLF